MDNSRSTDVLEEILKAIDDENFASARFTISSAIDKACGAEKTLRKRPAYKPEQQQPNLPEQSL